MLTDYDILHIPETYDISVIKNAYRKIVKEIHPDVCRGSFQKHLLFIQVNKAYQRLMEKIKGREINNIRDSHFVSSPGAGIIKYKDPAYAFYKAGMNNFMKIHPSQWNIETTAIMNRPGEKDMEALENVKNKVRNLVKLFPRAYYYFSIVVHEYPDSVWYQDSLEKINLIEERTVLYRKIIESFTEHAKKVPRVNKMFPRSRK